MTARRLFLDDSPGERRGVVFLDGRPERLIIERAGDAASQQLGARLVARVRRTEKALRTAFLDLGEGPDGTLPIGGSSGAPTEGAWLEVEIAAPGRGRKGPVVRRLQAGEGPVRLLSTAPDVERRLQGYAPKIAIEQGPAAREAADLAQETALQIEHPLPGGGRLFIEETQALTAIDVDLAGGASGDSGRAASRINALAIAWAARLLRLKGLGGLIAIDLAGRGHDGERLTAAAKAAFAPDGQGVSIGPISRFGVLELALPRTARPISDLLLGADGRLSDATLGLALLRRVEAEARPGALIDTRCHPDVAEVAQTLAPDLVSRIGARFTIVGEPTRRRDEIEVTVR